MHSQHLIKTAPSKQRGGGRHGAAWDMEEFPGTACPALLTSGENPGHHRSYIRWACNRLRGSRCQSSLHGRACVSLLLRGNGTAFAHYLRSILIWGRTTLGRRYGDQAPSQPMLALT
jgi:hypothetical protein